MTTIAIIGTGPTGVYAFKALATTPRATPLTIWLFEKGADAGVGMPYSDDTASTVMLANIASIEIPPVTQTYLDWLQAQTGALLRSHGIDPDDVDERDFTPRLMLGRYYRDEFNALVHAAEGLGHHVELRERTEVTDMIPQPDGRIRLMTEQGEVEADFDKVILATGHTFPEDSETRRYFPSPWSGLVDAVIPACRVGVLGTSLSAIDAAMAVATQHGRFVGRRGEPLRFEPTDPEAAAGLKITLMSRSGVLPEADFWCPIPYEPLSVLTEQRLAALPKGPGLLDAIFGLFQDELAAADPAYSAAVDLASATADDFSARYFAARKGADPFAYARNNLAEVEANRAARRTVPWRYAILRMHEVVEGMVDHLTDEDRARFDGGIKRVFVDNYAAVPPESIRRLLALHEAGILDVTAIGSDWQMKRGAKTTRIEADGTTLEFDVFIDARGQKPLEAADLPFPTLRAGLADSGAETVEVDDDYALLNGGPFDGHVLMGAIPYLMHDRPFAQGITAAADIGGRIGTAVLAEAARERIRCRRRSWDAREALPGRLSA